LLLSLGSRDVAIFWMSMLWSGDLIYVWIRGMPPWTWFSHGVSITILTIFLLTVRDDTIVCGNLNVRYQTMFPRERLTMFFSLARWWKFMSRRSKECTHQWTGWKLHTFRKFGWNFPENRGWQKYQIINGLHVYYYVPLHILCEIYSCFSHQTLSEIKIHTDWWINRKNDLLSRTTTKKAHSCRWDFIQGLDHGSFQINCTTL
jgi:hypothetical protein